MDRVEALNNMLGGVGVLVSWIAQEIAGIPFEPKRKNMKLITECASRVVDIELKVWDGRPDLAPIHMKPERNDNNERIVYGPDNPMPDELVRKLEIMQAIKVLESFRASGKNKYLNRIAEDEVQKLNRLLGET